MDYVAGDHLMSTAALTNTGSQNTPYAIPEKDSWDAWGKRRNINGSDNANCNITSGTLRGFTGQEMMDSFCLVNLNGRVYDPTIGRFLSADPTVPDPLNGQALNRYSYVLNNPLALVDPSGYADTCNDSDKCQIYSEGSSPCWGCSGPGVWGVAENGQLIGAPAAAFAFSGNVTPGELEGFGFTAALLNFGSFTFSAEGQTLTAPAGDFAKGVEWAEVMDQGYEGDATFNFQFPQLGAQVTNWAASYGAGLWTASQSTTSLATTTGGINDAAYYGGAGFEYARYVARPTKAQMADNFAKFRGDATAVIFAPLAMDPSPPSMGDAIATFDSSSTGEYFLNMSPESQAYQDFNRYVYLVAFDYFSGLDGQANQYENILYQDAGYYHH